MFCATQFCTKYDSIHVGTWLHNFSWVLRAIVFVSHILNMTSEACVAIISVLECTPEKAKKRCLYINDWIPIDTCCATSPLTMQTSWATAVLHKQYQNSSDFMQQTVQIVNQHNTRSTSCTTRNVAQHDWSWMGPFTQWVSEGSGLWVGGYWQCSGWVSADPWTAVGSRLLKRVVCIWSYCELVWLSCQLQRVQRHSVVIECNWLRIQ
jgi:hypothetical protein